MGCSDCCSTAAAEASSDLLRADTRSSGSAAPTLTSPRVSVPVLSNATAVIPASRSSDAPPLMSTPWRAAPASAETIDTGVEITSAHGHATTRTTSAR